MREGRVLEAFGSGTAAVVLPIKGLHYDGEDFEIPVLEEHKAGEVTIRIFEHLHDIFCGRNKHPWVQTITFY